MWKLESTDDYERSLKWYAKKRRREMLAVLENLDGFFEALLAGAKPQQIKAGYIHPEPRGVLAIDQKGGGVGLQETRLYTFPDELTEVLYLIDIGNKNTQSRDVKRAAAFVESLTKNRKSK